MKIGIVANSEICVPILYYCHQHGIAATLFLQTAPQNNEEIIRSHCQNLRIKIIVADAKALYEWANSELPDVVFVAGYNKRIDLKKLPSFSHGIYNIHFGKLPDFRGPSPVFWQLKNGMEYIGITIHRLTEKLDSGPVIWEKLFKNEHYFNYTYINQLLTNATVEGINAIVNNILAGKPQPEVAQDETRSAYFSKPVLKDVVLDWASMSATEIVNTVKACNAWNVGAIALYNGFEVKIADIQHYTNPAGKNAAPGTIINATDTLEVACVNNEIARINIININGITLASRLAAFYGFKEGTIFSSSFLPN